MKIIVTGGAGFIGSNLVDALVESGHEVAVVDNLSTGFKANLNKKAKFYEVDVTDRKTLEKTFGEFLPEAVFHLAAQLDVRKSVEDPAFDLKVNVTGSINVFELAGTFGVKKIVFSSTGGAIYGDGAEIPTPETTLPEPISPYGINKLAAEKFLKSYADRYKLGYTILRYANVYGPRQNSKGEAGVIAIFTHEMLKNEPVTIYGDGTQTRDFVFVGDVVRANLLALKSDLNDTFNIATGLETPLNDLVEKLKHQIKSDSIVTNMPARKGEMLRSCLNATKASLNLDFKPETTLDEGLRKTVEYLKNVKD